MADFEQAGVSEADWRAATASCVELRVAKVIGETTDSNSLVLEIPAELVERFRYRPGQFLSFKIPYAAHVLTRSYSLASSPDADREHKVTVKRVEDGRISNWINDRVEVGIRLMVVPPAGSFVLNDADRRIILFGGGSGITPVISFTWSALFHHAIRDCRWRRWSQKLPMTPCPTRSRSFSMAKPERSRTRRAKRSSGR
jgi:3-ketosteroid 9alpha-monooxygenase subunit B